MEDGQKRGTFRTYSCFIDTHDITFRNLTIANTAGEGPKVGQALALYADGDRLFFDNCHLQDHFLQKKLRSMDSLGQNNFLLESMAAIIIETVT